MEGRVNGAWRPDGEKPFIIDDNYIAVEYDLAQAIRGPEWFADANCRTRFEDDEEAAARNHINVFFPEPNRPGSNHLAEPRQMCLSCAVRYQCLEYGLAEPYGVWGGHSPSQRRRISAAVKNGSTLENASREIDARSRDARRTN